MNQGTWADVDSYIAEHLIGEKRELDAALAASEAAGLPPMAISPNQGKFLELLARAQQARSILELGTLGGYSTIWLARALPTDGRLVTLERDPRYAEVAGRSIAKAGFSQVVEIRIGSAVEHLRQLRSEGPRIFDLIFIDADKRSNPTYLKWSLRLSRPGTLIVADNVVRAGAIVDPQASDPELGEGGITGLRRFYEMLAAEPRLCATAIQTVGVKGHDGFALALVTGT